MSAENISQRGRESGQITMMFVLFMGIFLLGFVGLATDYTSLWFKRQAVQGATDSMCQAAAVDLLLYAQSAQTNTMGFTPSGSLVTCSGTPNAAPCKIANYNGFDGTASSNTITMSFPTSVTGVTGASGAAWPFVTVNLTNQAPAYFSSLITRQRTHNVHATATCGIVATLGPGTNVVLRPFPQITTYTQAAGSTFKVVGGGSVGVQVNAASIHATSFGSGAKADFSQGGTTNGGSDFAVTGTQADPGTSVYVRGTNGQWVSPDLPELDPFKGTSAPGIPGSNGTSNNNVSSGTNGCPAASGQKCTEYTGGSWPAGITVAASTIAIFDPGLYYMGGDLTVPSTSVVRMATPAGNSSHYGVFFYFTSGKPNITIGTNANLDNTKNPASTTLSCNGSSPPTAYNIPSTITGSVLVAPCTTNGVWTTANGNKGDTSGNVRGLLFMTASTNASTAAAISGNSAKYSILVGNAYLHNSSYTVTTTLTGTGADSLNIWGEVVTDILTISGAFETQVFLGGSGTSPLNRTAMLK